MKLSLIILLSILLAGNAFSQSLKKYAIGSSGCSAYFYCDPGTFAVDKSDDSSDVYTGECALDKMSYGVICVKLKNQVKDLEACEELLIMYLDYLKKSLNIVNAAGYGKGQRLKGNEKTRGVLDYWKDKDKVNWKIKAWTDGRYIGVMYIYSEQLLNETKGDIFLSSLVLPGM